MKSQGKYSNNIKDIYMDNFYIMQMLIGKY